MNARVPSFPAGSMSRWGAIAILLFLAACATGRDPYGTPSPRGATPNPHAKIGTPYTVNGRVYVPRSDPGYRAQGIASWYGTQFHGRLTANGELFDMNRLTAAHKTLPLPSLVEVENLENGKRVVLRLNDRGPFAQDRIIDLSAAAADALGMREKGLARVEVRYLGPASLSHAITRIGEPETVAALTPHRHTPAPAQTAPPVVEVTYAPPTPKTEVIEWVAPKPGYYVQVGTFSSAANAEAAASRLPSVVPVTTLPTLREGQVLHQVRLGPYAYDFAAEEARKVAARFGFADSRVVKEGPGD